MHSVCTRIWLLVNTLIFFITGYALVNSSTTELLVEDSLVTRQLLKIILCTMVLAKSAIVYITAYSSLEDVLRQLRDIFINCMQTKVLSPGGKNKNCICSSLSPK